MKFILSEKFLSQIAVGILIVFFTIFYLGDGVTKFLYRMGADFYRYGLFIKAFACLVVLVYGIVFLNRSKLNILLLMLILTVFFLIGQYSLSLSYDEMDFVENANTHFKYLFIFIFFLLVIDIRKLDTLPPVIINIYKLILTINGFLIIVGMVLKIPWLNTYNSKWRFGYDGLILAQNEASFIYIFALTFVYYRRFFQKKNELFFWIVVIPSLLVATKAVYLYIILLVLFHIFFKLPFKQAISFVLGGAIIGYLILRTTINKILVNAYEFFMFMYRRDGLLHAVLSGRNEFIDKKLVPLITEHWTIFNFLFGGQDVISHYIEMGIFDLILFFGIIGSLLYLYAFFKMFRLLDFNRKFKIFFAISLFFIIATAGHFFESGIAGIHFIMLLLMCNNWNKSKDDNFIS